MHAPYTHLDALPPEECCQHPWRMIPGVPPKVSAPLLAFVMTMCIRHCDANATLTVETLSRYTAWLTNSSDDLRIPPIPPSGEPIDVDVGIFVNALGDINEMDMEFSINMYLRHQWNDYRLAYGDDITSDDSIVVPDAFFKDKIWVPDSFFENGKTEYLHEIIVDNWMFRVYRNGDVYFSQRLSVKAWCFLELYRFPLDLQTCELRIMSYRYKTGEMKLRWMADGPMEHGAIHLARFDLLNKNNLTIGDCTTGFSTGSYSCVFAQFRFQRLFGYYLIQIYIPSGLIVLLSWVSFFLDPLAVPGRISLGVLTILTMSTQMASAATSSLPKVSYVKAIDVWLTTCMCFLFAALLEFALVNSLARRAIHKTHKVVVADDGAPRLKLFVQRMMDVRAQNGEISPRMPPEAMNPPDEVDVETAKSRCCLWLQRNCFRAIKIDIISRTLFPVSFSAFNIIYWLLYTQEQFFYLVDGAVDE